MQSLPCNTPLFLVFWSHPEPPKRLKKEKMRFHGKWKVSLDTLNFVWELLACVAMVKVGYSPSSRFTATEWINLKTMGEVIGRLFLINYSLGTNSTVKSFKQLRVAKSTIYKVLQNLENRGATEKQLASGWPAVKLTKGKRKHLVNAAMDTDQVSLTKNAKNFGVQQIYVRRVFKWEGLKYCKRTFTKADSWEGRRPDSTSLVGSSWSGCRQSHQPLSRL